MWIWILINLKSWGERTNRRDCTDILVNGDHKIFPCSGGACQWPYLNLMAEVMMCLDGYQIGKTWILQNRLFKLNPVWCVVCVGGMWGVCVLNLRQWWTHDYPFHCMHMSEQNQEYIRLENVSLLPFSSHFIPNPYKKKQKNIYFEWKTCELN